MFWKIISKLVPIEGLSRLDVESMIVSLLDQGFAKGYISPDRKIIVFRKSNAFPMPFGVSEALR